MENNTSNPDGGNFRASLYVGAIVVLVLGVLGSISWVSSRPGAADTTVTVSGILAYTTPIVAAILALLGGLAAQHTANKAANLGQANQDAITEVNNKVNGQMSKLVEAATNPESNVIIPPEVIPTPMVDPVRPAGQAKRHPKA